MNAALLLSVPRSGSSWIGKVLSSSPQVIYRFQPSFAYSFPHRIDEDSSAKEVQVFREALLKTKDPFVCGKITIDGKKIKVDEDINMADCLVWKEVHNVRMANALLNQSDAKVIGLIRNPLAVLYSWMKAPKEFNPEWDFEQEWKLAELKNAGDPLNFFGFNKWLEAARLFHQLKEKYPNRIHLLSYSKMIADPMGEGQCIFDFLDLEWNTQTESFIKASTSSEEVGTYSVFKKRSEDDAWKGHIAESIVSAVKDELKALSLDQYLH